MAKAEQSPQLNYDQQALVKALTEAIISARRDVSPLSDVSIAAAKEYAQIKGALRTIFEPGPDPATSTSKQYA